MIWILFWKGIKLYFTCDRCRQRINKTVTEPFKPGRPIAESIRLRALVIVSGIQTLQLMHTIYTHDRAANGTSNR